MIKVENLEAWGFEHAIRGMRNPMNSWDRSDSYYEPANFCDHNFIIGDNDLDLMRRLYKAGGEHRKYLRQIFVSFDITAPFYFWKEFSTYKFVAPDNDGIHIDTNSCSTMHKIHTKEFALDDFSYEHILDEPVLVEEDGCYYENKALDCLKDTIDMLNTYRKLYLQTKDKKYWWQLIQLLPSSYNQKRTVTMSYETVVSIIKQRTGHRLDEWNNLVDILKTLPYVKEIMEIE